MVNHWSDCALHNGPARVPGWCDCGGIKGRPSFFATLRAFLYLRLMFHMGRL